MTPRKKPTTKSLPANSNTLLDSLLKYIFAALLIFVPLYPKFPFMTVPGTYVAIRFEDFILGALAVILFLKLLKSPIKLSKHHIIRTIMIFWLVGLIATISGIYLTKTTSTSLGLLHWARRVEYSLPFIAAFLLARNRANLEFFIRLIPAVAASVLIYGVAQIYYDAPAISTQNAEFSTGIALTLQPGVNLSSTFAGHYDLATYLTMTLAILASIFIIIRSSLYKVISLMFLLALFWLQLRTGSRIAFGASTIAVSLVFIIAKKSRWVVPVVAIAVVGMINTPSISGRFGNLFDVLKFEKIQNQVKGVMDTRGLLFIDPVYALEALEPTPTPIEKKRAIQEDRSTSIRIDVEWPRALRALYKNPFLGTGYGSISLATDNDYLRALGETGLLGFLALGTVILNIFVSLQRALKQKLSSLERHFVIGALGMTVGFLIIATFIDVFEASKVATLFWMYTGLATGIEARRA